MKQIVITNEPAPMTAEVYSDIKNFLFSNIDAFRKDADEYEYLELTVAVSADGTEWNYQTGDNSFTGCVLQVRLLRLAVTQFTEYQL